MNDEKNFEKNMNNRLTENEKIFHLKCDGIIKKKY